MQQIIIHYNDGERKEDLFFSATNPQEALVILLRETAPEKLWSRNWDKKYIWNEVR